MIHRGISASACVILTVMWFPVALFSHITVAVFNLSLLAVVQKALKSHGSRFIKRCG